MNASDIVRIRVRIEAALLGGDFQSAQTLMHQTLGASDDAGRVEARRLACWVEEEGMTLLQRSKIATSGSMVSTEAPVLS